MATASDEIVAVIWSLVCLGLGIVVGCLAAIYLDGKDARIRRLEREVREISRRG